MLVTRDSGILLHPTSLPGPYGIGEFGDAAIEFIHFLIAAKQTRWQVLPLGPTGYGDSPYASFSSFAGNPNLISLQRLIESGDLSADEVVHSSDLSDERVNFGALLRWKTPLLRKAATRFLDHSVGSDKRDERVAAFHAFCDEQSDWLVDYAIFMALKDHFDQQAEAEGFVGALWNTYWPAELARREPAAMAAWTEKLEHEIEVRKVWQFTQTNCRRRGSTRLFQSDRTTVGQSTV